MGNRLYDKGRQAILEGLIPYLTDTIKLVLVSGAYVPNTATDQFLSAIAPAQRVATSGALTGKTAIDGVADADDVSFLALVGPPVSYLVLYQDTGADATSRLIALWDTVAGMPFAPNGGNVFVEWDNGPSKIFKL